MKWIIYTLKNPRTNEVRYVGWTSRGAEKRLTAHITEAVCRPRTHVNYWVLSLASIGLTPIIDVVESGDGDGWREAERRWIATFRSQGAKLANHTDGGDGILGLRYTPEQRARLSEGKRAAWAERTPAERNALNVRLTRERRSEVTRNSWAKLTLEERAARTASRTVEDWAAAARKQWVGLTPEERAAKNAAAYMAGLAKEPHSSNARKHWDRLTAEERFAFLSSVSAKKWGKLTAEERSALAKRAWTNSTRPLDERRAEISAWVRAGWAKLTPEERSARARKGKKVSQ